MLLASLLCATLALAAPARTAQDPAPPDVPDAAQAPDAYGALVAEYDAALVAWEETRIGRKHPARAFYARFRELAGEDLAGEGRAVVWMLGHGKDAGLSVIARRSEMTGLYLALVEKHLEHDYAVEALLGLPNDARDVDAKRLVAACRAAGAGAQGAEARAAAWFALAALRAADGTEEGAQEAEALRLSVMLELDGTRAAAAMWDAMAAELEREWFLAEEGGRSAITSELMGLAERGSSRARAFVMQNAGGTADMLPWVEDAIGRAPDAAETMQLARALPALAAAIGDERVETIYRGWLAKSTVEATRVEIRFELGRFLLERYADDEVKGGEALALLDAVRAVDPETWGPRVEGEINRLVRLKIGAAAPEIEAVTVDGAPFKLSDFRGNVVVLEFWGFW